MPKAKVNIKVLILPDRREGRGKIDPTIPLGSIKADIAEAYKLGDPDSWTLAIVPDDRQQRLSPETYTVSEGDTLLMLPNQNAIGRGFVPEPSD